VEKINIWGKKHKARVEALALALTVLPPFGVYAGLESGSPPLAWAAFGLLTLGFGLVVWIN
jgi:hypothetical protein